jgi:hypothetical protein
MNETNEMNELETQLGLWTPRHPSARLERRLFAAGAAPVEALLPFRFTWLAPATAALMLMCVLFNQRYAASLSAATTPGPLVAMILSNQSAAAYLPGSFKAEQNNLPADTFKWTRSRPSTSGAAYLSRLPGSKQP